MQQVFVAAPTDSEWWENFSGVGAHFVLVAVHFNEMPDEKMVSEALRYDARLEHPTGQSHRLRPVGCG